MWAKYTAFEIAHRAPLMLHVPGEIDSYVESDKLVEFVDIFPTLVESAGFDQISRCPTYSRNISLCREGSSILDLVRNPEEWKSAIFYQHPMYFGTTWQMEHQGYSVMTEEYRYSEYVNIRNVNQEEQEPNWSDPIDFGELYDLVNDPLENINLFHNEDHQDTIADLKKLLHQGWHQHN